MEFAAFPLAGFCRVLKRRKNSKVGFHRLKIFEVGVCDVVAQRSEHRGLGQDEWRFLSMEPGCVHASQQTRGNISHIAFHSGDLSGKEKVIPLDVLQCWAKEFR